MLTLLNISNIALVDDLRVEFDSGLNLLTGETGSGKSIIVDALGVLTGGRFTSDLLRAGAERAFIEGSFSVADVPTVAAILDNAGIQSDGELIIRRELSANGRNKIFINNQLATLSLLRDLREFLVDIHGQGDQQTLLKPETHLELLDAFAANASARKDLFNAYQRWLSVKRELDALHLSEAERFQLVDTLSFQIDELENAHLAIGEDHQLEEERRRLLNVEQLTSLSTESYQLIYEDDDAALVRVRQTLNRLERLAEFEPKFRDYLEGLESARAVIEDVAFSLRDFSDHLEFSAERLAQIDDRLAELSRLKRKYGGTIESALEHLASSQDRKQQIDRADERESELKSSLATAADEYLRRATNLHDSRIKAARKFERIVEQGLGEVAMTNARFQVQITRRTEDNGSSFGPTGTDAIEFNFSANSGEDLKPLARVASGGEASRLMLVLKTVANASEFPRTIVFDEIDAGIGGRVSEAVGIKLKKLAQTNQVLCVTHQAQIARFADSHLVVEKQSLHKRTEVGVIKLDRKGRVEEIARMLTGAQITESARKHAKELLKI